LAVPGISAHELFIIRAAFIPMREERTAEVKALPVPALRHHVQLLADLLFIDLFWLMRVRYIKDTHLAVAETVHEQSLIIGTEADVYWQHAALLVAHGRDFLGLPFAVLVFVAEPEFRCQCSGGE